MTESAALDFISRSAETTAILKNINPRPDKKRTAQFLRSVTDALIRLPAQVELLEKQDPPSTKNQRAEDLAKSLKKALQVLQRMDEGTDGVIHQHFQLNEGVSLPQTRFHGPPIEGTLRALIDAVAKHQKYDIEKSSKLKPENRRNMPLLFHVGQAWAKYFWDENQENDNGAKISARDNSAFYKFVEFLIHEVIGDRKQSIESLIRTAIKENLLPKLPGK